MLSAEEAGRLTAEKVLPEIEKQIRACLGTRTSILWDKGAVSPTVQADLEEAGYAVSTHDGSMYYRIGWQ